MTNVNISRAAQDDLPAILDVQKKAFREVARFFHIETLPPLEQTLSSIAEEFEKGTILKAALKHDLPPKDKSDFRHQEKDQSYRTIIGSVRAYQKSDTCFIGRLVVLPEHQNQGIGKALMCAIENQYRHAVKRYEIYTGTRDPRNRYLYDQLGYKPFKTEKLNDDVTFVFMEKYSPSIK